MLHACLYFVFRSVSPRIREKNNYDAADIPQLSLFHRDRINAKWQEKGPLFPSAQESAIKQSRTKQESPCKRSTEWPVVG